VFTFERMNTMNTVNDKPKVNFINPILQNTDYNEDSLDSDLEERKQSLTNCQSVNWPTKRVYKTLIAHIKYIFKT